MKTKIISLILVLAMCLGLLCSCGECKHEEMGEWENFDAANHTRACLNEKCDYKEVKAHEWAADGEREDTEAGKLYKKFKCSVCGATKEEEDTSFDPWLNEQKNMEYPWNETSLIFQMSDSSNAGELSSGSRAYLSGDLGEGGILTDITSMVLDRNAAAYKATNTKVTYEYWPDNNSSYNWGNVMGQIDKLVMAAGSEAPDMYVDFIYDMIGASVKGFFKNTLCTEAEFGKSNYFAFNSKYFDAEKDDRGYVWNYMETLSFAPDKIFLIASDYFVDVVRSIFVTMVSVDNLAEVTNVTGDADGDGTKGTSIDFLTNVLNKKWTWAKVAEYSEAFTKNNSASGFADGLGDSKIGLIFDNSTGMAMTAICYATDVSFVTRELNAAGTEYVYTYTATPSEFYALGAEFKTVFATKGMIGCNYYSGGEKANSAMGSTGLSATPATLTVFNNGNALFAGPVMLGATEDPILKPMWDAANNRHGFLVMPVPMSKNMTDYSSAIHNVGRVGAIASSSSKFTQASAFLNWVSTNSEDILEEYYTWNLQMDAAGGLDENVEILSNLRNQLKNTIDKVIEDAVNITVGRPKPTADEWTSVGLYKSATTHAVQDDSRWHAVIMSADNNADGLPYSAGDKMRTAYEFLVEAKKTKLQEVVDKFNGKATPAAQ